jgi:hypothetical protein
VPGQAISRYIKTIGALTLLNKAKEVLGVSWYQLAHLLALPGEQPASKIWGWRHGIFRPSALYLSRLAWLLVLRCEGHQVNQWAKIDWERGEVVLRSGKRGQRDRIVIEVPKPEKSPGGSPSGGVTETPPSKPIFRPARRNRNPW